jgi:hypothetical protein
MKYWRAKIQTPYVGEDEEIYFEAKNEEHAREIAWDALVDNAYNWYDEEYYDDIDDAIEQSEYYLYELTEEEYRKETEEE